MPEAQIVKLKPEEWRLYKQIRLESVRMEPHAFGGRYSEILQRSDSYWQNRLIETQAEKNSWLLFAKENEQIIGMIGAFGSEEQGVIEIISVYVTKEKRGYGTANLLMAAILEEIGKNRAYRKAVLGVNANQTAAVALYQHFGFKIIGTRDGVMGDGNTYTSYTMEKELNHSAWQSPYPSDNRSA